MISVVVGIIQRAIFAHIPANYPFHSYPGKPSVDNHLILYALNVLTFSVEMLY